MTAVETLSLAASGMTFDARAALGREAAEATADHVTGPYRFLPLDGVGHWVVEAAPAPVAEALVAHLGS